MDTDTQKKIIALIGEKQHKAAGEIAELIPTSMIPEVHREIRVYLGQMELAKEYRLSEDQGMAEFDARERLITGLDALKEGE